jgi:hypothetical protein
MALRVPGCRSLETAALWTGKNFIVDGVLLAEGGIAALLGLLGLRFVPMALLALGWKFGEYVVKACAPLSLISAQAALRPALGDFAVLMGGWALGRVVRRMLRRRRPLGTDSLLELGPMDSGVDDAGEPPPPPRPTGRRPARTPGRVPSASMSSERSWTTPGSIVLELDDREAEALRAALDSRLSDLRRVADRPGPGGVRDEIWQTIATLESLLAHLPAAHLYERATGGWSPSGHRLG